MISYTYSEMHNTIAITIWRSQPSYKIWIVIVALLLYQLCVKGLCLKSSSSALRVILSVSLPFDRFLVYLCPNPEIPLSHITPPLRLSHSVCRPSLQSCRGERRVNEQASCTLSGWTVAVAKSRVFSSVRHCSELNCVTIPGYWIMINKITLFPN